MARRILKDARCASFTSYLSTLNSWTPMLSVWKRVRKVAGKFSSSSPPVVKVSGNPISDNVAVADSLAEAFVGVSSRASRSQAMHCELKAEESRQLDFLFGWRELQCSLFIKGTTFSSLQMP